MTLETSNIFIKIPAYIHDIVTNEVLKYSLIKKG